MLLAGLTVANFVILALHLAYDAESMKGENGILETAQLLLLLGTAISFGLVAVRSYPSRIAATGAACTITLFFFRELEIHGVHPIFEFMSSDPMLYVLGAIFGISIILILYLTATEIPAFWSWCRRREWWPFLVAGVLLIAGYVVEGLGQELVEEILETNAYVVLAITGGAAASAVLRKP